MNDTTLTAVFLLVLIVSVVAVLVYLNEKIAEDDDEAK